MRPRQRKPDSLAQLGSKERVFERAGEGSRERASERYARPQSDRGEDTHTEKREANTLSSTADMGSGKGSGAGEAVIQTKEKLVGAAHFKRVNPMSDRFEVK